MTHSSHNPTELDLAAIVRPSKPRRAPRVVAWTVALTCLCPQALADDRVAAQPPDTEAPNTAAQEAGKPATQEASPTRQAHRNRQQDPNQQAPEATPGVINLNTADAATLQRLPGIGPAKADAILALRARLKAFKRIEQLMRVRGIGRKTFRKLRPMIAVSGATTLERKVRSSPTPR